MFHKALSATIAAVLFFPVCVQAAVIEYQEVGLRYVLFTGVTDFDTQELDGQAFSTQIEPNPQDIAAQVSLNGTSSFAGLNFDLDEANNTFALDVSLNVSSNPAENTGANAVVQIRLFVDFMLQSDTSELVELDFSVDNVFTGLDDFATSIALASSSSRLADGSTTTPGQPGSRTVGPVLAGLGGGGSFPITGGTESLILSTDQPYSFVATIDIENRVSTDEFLDAIGGIQLSTTLAARDVPEPPLMGALALGLLLCMRKHAPGK